MNILLYILACKVFDEILVNFQLFYAHYKVVEKLFLLGIFM